MRYRNATVIIMVTSLLTRLGKSDLVKNAVRRHTYIKNVTCACKNKESITGKSFHGKDCYCELDYDLFGQPALIRTHETQPTFNIRVEHDPVNFARYAETRPIN
jgi:hypothetical protein